MKREVYKMFYLENAKEHFALACGNFGENSESVFYHKIANMVPDCVSVEGLILVFKIAFQDAERAHENTTPFIALVPRYIDQFATPEFALEFRKKYNLEILGLTQDALPDVDYGCLEIAPDVIDISSKDRGAVFAALYNASTPVGAGFFQYNPMSWDAEMGEYFFHQFGTERNDGSVYFGYVVGRAVDVLFKDNLLYVRNYNYNNGFGCAQKAVSTVPNKEDDVELKIKK